MLGLKVTNTPEEIIMALTEKIIVVAGATGNQGGAVARHLLAGGWKVRAMTRNPASSAAKALAALGAEVVAADLDRPDSIATALRGAYGVFSVQNYYEKGVGYEGEIRQGRTLAEAAQQVGICHFVQSTMAKGRDAEHVEHFRSKIMIERLIGEFALPASFIGTVWFMDNLLDKTKGGEMSFPVLAGTLGSERPFESLYADDIGKAALRMFAEPDRSIGQHVPLAGDRLTIKQMRETFYNVIGRRPPSFPMPNLITRFVNADFAAQLRWQRDIGWDFPLGASKALVPDIRSFRDFLSEKRILLKDGPMK
jgi:uncharacterized protein YbjT (DUF2867 family)